MKNNINYELRTIEAINSYEAIFRVHRLFS